MSAEAKKQWAANNPDKKKASHKKFSEANPEKVRTSNKKWYAANKEKARAGHLRRTYGLTLEEFQAMSEQQGHVCAICKRPKKLVVDHCHKTDRVRGLPCATCNQGLGIFLDDPELLIAAAEYLKRHEQ